MRLPRQHMNIEKNMWVREEPWGASTIKGQLRKRCSRSRQKSNKKGMKGSRGMEYLGKPPHLFTGPDLLLSFMSVPRPCYPVQGLLFVLEPIHSSLPQTVPPTRNCVV